MKMDVNNGYLFENIVVKIFEKSGYVTNQNVQLANKKGDIDIIVEKDNRKFCVEVKYTRITEKAIQQIYNIAESNEMEPLLVTAYEIDGKRKEYYQDSYPRLIFIDISNLLYAVQYDVELRSELIANLPYVVDDVIPQEGGIQLGYLQHDDYTASLIRDMEYCNAGRAFASTYEELCFKLLENIFSDDLALWKKTAKIK